MKKKLIIRLQNKIISCYESIERLRKLQHFEGNFSFEIVNLESVISDVKTLIKTLENSTLKKAKIPSNDSRDSFNKFVNH